MIGVGVNPHGLGGAGAFEAVFLVEGDGGFVGDEDALVEVLVFGEEALEDLGADALVLIVWVNEEMGEVGDKVAVGEGVAEADELILVPGSDEGVGVAEAFLELGGFVSGGPVVGGVEREELFLGDGSGLAICDGGHGVFLRGVANDGAGF